MPFSTSSSDPSWRRFVLRLLAVWAGGAALLLLLLALIDPWGALGLPITLPRRPADKSQRWAYPELARDPRFDAAIIGSSTSRLFNPADLDPAVGARFVNLAMVNSRAWEQSRLLDVFLAAHPAPRAIMIGIDRVWCVRGDAPELFGYDPIPEWLYRGDRLAAVANLLNLHAIETGWRGLAAGLGLAPAPYGENGYALIGVDFHPYDPARARFLLHDDRRTYWPAAASPDPATWRYAALEWLAQRLDRLPTGTRVLLVFVPRHHLYPAPGSVGAETMAECRLRVIDLARARPNVELYDADLPSPITTEDDRWWDAVHARPETMARVSGSLARAIGGDDDADVRLLDRDARQPRSVSQR